MPSKRPPDDPADADLLFDDDPPRRPTPSARHPSRRQRRIRAGRRQHRRGRAGAHPRAAFVPAAPSSKPKSKAKVETNQEPRVDQVWTRGAEWGTTLAIVGAIGAAVVVADYFLILWLDQWGLGFLLLLIGAAVCLVFSYPIMITLERPVRITPEQAAKDYFGALSHGLPHYKRMWLLLSTPGREDPEFGSFGAFRAYWQRRMAQLKSNAGKAVGTLAFEVADFKAEKSAGKTFVDGKYTVVVRAGGDASGPPLETIRVDSSFAKGPDNMWYLNSGTLPGRI